MLVIQQNIGLSTLLWQLLSDAGIYSALVPWILDARLQAPSLSAFVQQKQVLQDHQLQVPDVSPHRMRQYVLQTAGQLCRSACNLTVDSCLEATTAHNRCSCSTSVPDTHKAAHKLSSNDRLLIQPALRLAKLHGHIMSNGLAPNLSEQLHTLFLLLTSAPLQGNCSDTVKSGKCGRPCSQASEGWECYKQSLVTCSTSATAVATDIISMQLLCCRTCAAGYAAKALECCSRLLCCLPGDVVYALASNPHVQQYAPSLAAQLLKSTASNSSAATMHRNAAIVGCSSASTDFGQQQHTLATPAGAGGCHLHFATATPVGQGAGSAGGSWSIPPGVRPSTGGKGTQLSGLGLLVHNTPGSTGGRSTGGRTHTTKTNSAAVCNREKSRDLFFSILRKCSSRLDALRQHQAAADGLDDSQQRAAAAAVYTAELQELLEELSLATKQLLLQLAPGNQTYLAELFTACVLQAASTGAPILDPHLAVMAERDPGKFQKLQQRLGDRISGASGAAPVHTAATATRPKSAGGTGASAFGAKSGSATMSETGMQLSAPNSAPLAQQHRQSWAQAHQQPQHKPSVYSGSHEGKTRVQSAVQGLAATGLMYKNLSSSKSTGGSAGRPASTAARHIRPTPSSAGSSNRSRFKAASGMETPVPFAAAGASAEPSAQASSQPQASCAAGTSSIAETAVVISRCGEATPHCQQPTDHIARSMQHPAVSRVVQLGATNSYAQTADRAIVATAAVATAPHRTPASAPAAAASYTKKTSAAAATPIMASSSPTPAAAAPPAQQNSTVRVVQQLLAELPAGQHVLLLLLHAADSSSFNSSVLQVMLTRAEQILSSTPTSLSAAAGLGQQAAALVALASYCSYLSFVAVAGATESTAGSSTGSGAMREKRYDNQQHLTSQQPVLQLQPLVDVLSLLCNANDAGVHGNKLDASWRLALTVPFVCGYLQFIGCSNSAASSSCVLKARQQLQVLQGLPCMSASHPAFGSLQACLACCVSQQVADTTSLVIEAAEATEDVWCCSTGHQQRPGLERPRADAADGTGLSDPAGWWCTALQQGSQLVDGSYWAVCCPGLHHIRTLLGTRSAAVHKQQQQQQPRSMRVTANKHPAQGTETSPPAKQQPAKTMGAAAEDASQPIAAADSTQKHGSTSPAGSLRHTTPLLLAPREPPVLETLPSVITEALAEANDPLKQQLQQAFLCQYSTDDNPVKMRDVLSLVNGVLCANSLSLALCQGVPPVIQQHLDAMSKEVHDELGPVGAPSRLQLQGQDLARAVHSICSRHSVPAINAALESALQQASQHASQAATAACKALLPVDVPPAAASAAAALVAASCKASCAQKLLQEVPVLVQTAIADQADELVKHVTKQWAVHNRLTAPAAADRPAGEGSDTQGIPAGVAERPQSSLTSSRSPAVSTSSTGRPAPESAVTPTRAARRINPILVAEAAVANSDDASGDSTVRETVQAASTIDQPPQQQAAGSALADVARKLVSICTKSLQDEHTVEVGEALATMQQQVAAALARHSIADAVSIYLGVASRLRPTEAPHLTTSHPDSSPVCAKQQREVRRQQEGDCGSWNGVVAAAACAAELLVAGVLRGLCSLEDLEQQLVSLLSVEAGTNPKSAAVSAARVAVQGTNQEDAAAAGKQQSVSSLAEQQSLLHHLLAAAVLHAFITNTAQRSCVWGSEVGEQMPMSPELVVNRVSCGPQQFVLLPTLVMKAARCDKPTWFLKQLRVWIQHTTLGGA